jgi:hypothetical protein
LTPIYKMSMCMYFETRKMIGVSRLSMAQLDQSNIFGAFLSLFWGNTYFHTTSWSYIKSLKLEKWFGSNEIIWHQLYTQKRCARLWRWFFSLSWRWTFIIMKWINSSKRFWGWKKKKTNVTILNISTKK